MTDKAYLVLSPIGSPYHSYDAVPLDADCGHRCWIGPTALNAVVNPFMVTHTLCTPCLMADPKLRRALLEDVTEGGGLRALPGTREEMARSVGQEVADDIYDRLGVHEDLP